MKLKPEPQPLEEVLAEYDAEVIEQEEADQRDREEILLKLNDE